MPLEGQDLHFADQIDGLLERVGLIERFLGGRWKIADAATAVGGGVVMDADIERLTHERNVLETALGRRQKLYDEMRNERDRLKALLWKYGWHLKSCRRGIAIGSQCDCRWSEEREKLGPCAVFDPPPQPDPPPRYPNGSPLLSRDEILEHIHGEGFAVRHEFFHRLEQCAERQADGTGEWVRFKWPEVLTLISNVEWNRCYTETMEWKARDWRKP